MSKASASLLPKTFRDWFTSRGWQPREHQLQLLAKSKAGRSVLLVAPTGAGKTLAGFLPSLVELAEREPSRGTAKDRRGLHTLYISPLKALATDIARNLETPVHEMGLPIRIETRTGDTPSHKRARQIERPPDILLTTPEQLALLLAHREATEFFKDLRRVVLDELHSLVTSKRGDPLSLGLARLLSLAPQATAVGLSATVREPDDLRRYLVPQRHQPSPPLWGRDGEGGVSAMLVPVRRSHPHPDPPRTGEGTAPDPDGTLTPHSDPEPLVRPMLAPRHDIVASPAVEKLEPVDRNRRFNSSRGCHLQPSGPRIGAAIVAVAVLFCVTAATAAQSSLAGRGPGDSASGGRLAA